MSAPHWLADPWVRRLGWTLIQFLWQGAVIAGVFAGVRATCAPSRHEDGGSPSFVLVTQTSRTPCSTSRRATSPESR